MIKTNEIVRIDNIIRVTTAMLGHTAIVDLTVDIGKKVGYAEIIVNPGDNELRFSAYKHPFDDMLNVVCFKLDKDDNYKYDMAGFVHCNDDVWDGMNIGSSFEQKIQNTVGCISTAIDTIIMNDQLVREGKLMQQVRQIVK